MSYANRHAFGVDLGQHCLPMPLLWKVDKKRVKVSKSGLFNMVTAYDATIRYTTGKQMGPFFVVNRKM